MTQDKENEGKGHSSSRTPYKVIVRTHRLGGQLYGGGTRLCEGRPLEGVRAGARVIVPGGFLLHLGIKVQYLYVGGAEVTVLFSAGYDM